MKAARIQSTPWLNLVSAAVLTALVAAPCPARADGAMFQSGGVRLTVTSLAAKTRSVSLSITLENTSNDNLLVAIIGPPIGVNGGAAFGPEAIGGVAYCIYNPRNVPVLGLDRSEQINGCLKADKPQLTLDTFTLIEAGKAVPMTLALTSLNPVDPAKDFSFSMTVAVLREAELNAPGANGDRSGSLPRSLRYISVGIAPLSFSQK